MRATTTIHHLLPLAMVATSLMATIQGFSPCAPNLKMMSSRRAATKSTSRWIFPSTARLSKTGLLSISSTEAAKEVVLPARVGNEEGATNDHPELVQALESAASADAEPAAANEPATIAPAAATRLRRFREKCFSGPDDGLTLKQRLGKAGLSVALSYGWVSNVLVAATTSLSWFIASKRTGLSPLAPGQWKGFLGVYAGIYAFNNLWRPVRFGMAVGVAPFFDRAIQKVQDVLGVNKGLAIFLTVLLANVVGTCLLIASGISLASLASGVPVFVPKP